MTVAQVRGSTSGMIVGSSSPTGSFAFLPINRSANPLIINKFVTPIIIQSVFKVNIPRLNFFINNKSVNSTNLLSFVGAFNKPYYSLLSYLLSRLAIPSRRVATGIGLASTAKRPADRTNRLRGALPGWAELRYGNIYVIYSTGKMPPHFLQTALSARRNRNWPEGLTPVRRCIDHRKRRAGTPASRCRT